VKSELIEEPIEELMMMQNQNKLANEFGLAAFPVKLQRVTPETAVGPFRLVAPELVLRKY
jgi:hypothetical protein